MLIYGQRGGGKEHVAIYLEVTDGTMDGGRREREWRWLGFNFRNWSGIIDSLVHVIHGRKYFVRSVDREFRRFRERPVDRINGKMNVSVKSLCGGESVVAFLMVILPSSYTESGMGHQSGV